MPRTEWVLPATLVALIGLAACASPASPSIAACQSDEACPVGARCTASACVANSPPVARFTVTGDLQANVLVTLDAGASSDPDEGDSIQSYAWSITRISAACEAPAIADRTQTVTVRFPCAGEFEISLVVIDEMLVESAPRTKPVVVTARTGVPLVEAGPDQSVGHVCGGAPLQCRPASSEGQAILVGLSATLKSTSFRNVRWTVVPPAGREIGPGTGRTVTFIPSADVLEPSVELVTDGAGISGDWSFRVEVLDGAGVLDAATTRVSILNRTPSIEGNPPDAFDHRFDADNHSYSVRSSFPVQLVDPDGDPLTPRVTYRHTGDGDASFSARWIAAEGAATQSRVGLDIVANTSTELIAPGIERSILIEATDVNGGSASPRSVSIAVGNRPPAPLPSVPPTPAPHWYDVASGSYVSEPEVVAWTDPDGDPLHYAMAPDPGCELLPSSGPVRLRCEASTLGALMQEKTPAVRVGDPWLELEPAAVRVVIENHRPTVLPSVFSPAIACVPRGGTGPKCIDFDYPPPNAYGPIDATAPALNVTDEDGDPLELYPSSNAVVTPCAAGASSCPLTLRVPVLSSCSKVPPAVEIAYFATDGFESTAGTLRLEPHCR